jgi:tetratricopeptide (TPR) repeat protein
MKKTTRKFPDCPPRDSLRRVKKDFFQTTRILPYFDVNTPQKNKLSGSPVFDILGERAFDQPRFLVFLEKKIKQWLSWDTSAFTLCLAGYIHYIAERYQKAESFFLKALRLDHSNMDVWLALAFSLYHQGPAKQKLAHDILLAHRELSIHFRKRMTLKNIACFLADVSKKQLRTRTP